MKLMLTILLTLTFAYDLTTALRSELPGLVMEPESDEFMMRSLRPGLDAGQAELGLVEDQPLEWARLDYHAEVGIF